MLIPLYRNNMRFQAVVEQPTLYGNASSAGYVFDLDGLFCLRV